MALLRLRETINCRDRSFDLELGKPVPGMLLNLKNTAYCSIYRVPNSIRQVNPEAYTPQLIIIGPLHHSLKSQALKSRGDLTDTKSLGYLSMERHKKFYLEEFTLRVGGEQTIDELKAIIRGEEMMIRASYSESTAWIETPQFLDMILRDSVFIVEFLLRTHNRTLTRPGDPLIDEPCLQSSVKNDLVLLENQLPYFILERLFDPIVPRLLRGHTIRELIVESYIRKGRISDNSTFKHFTDLIRLIHVETLPQLSRRVSNNPIEHMYSANKLDSGGVEFEAVEEDLRLNMRFENGCLKIPRLTVHDKVEMRLRNTMALEQCHYPFEAYICYYVIFLDYLIDTHKDVELLVEKGIIKNWIGKNTLVAEMVNKLGLGITIHGSIYTDIALQVNAYYTNPINKSCAVLKRVYFGNLWIGTATIAATFLLLMTLIQTVASIFQVVK